MKKLNAFLGLNDIEKFSSNDTKDLIKLTILFFFSSLYSLFYTYDYYKSYLNHPSDISLMQNAKGVFIITLGLGYTFIYFFINIFISRRANKPIKKKG
ncbi:hypothetical protein [Clostridium manihotivorum]|uniref:Uncharacterized protein n=1 Tax=Clostridium manihotivorum TaxID=2320868 RepID=A0A3R5QYF3_9CLOT|nr:hypothetical protein [Clostridium manihotivorum]QAA35148.1 hypothetical protein C1I91_27830 [Clostridium manihotivorum]